ncbi:ectoine utilization protein EutA [Pseudohoeflea coraliihabitans]|uniref:Aspartate/glutamate racemase family protein n=1 Tax=Pseudohoeflea coraliihabitans TaxID=2860393 RepID=A0ABS6WJS1_9HYPH|nr:ectoine utilization protein EutA [Pseudohoeflea sp. DP4N28-3]MBW3096199.1 aspartate/glutamate racemase family protein [Pseudohoeflea sp. DP4N28-3]
MDNLVRLSARPVAFDPPESTVRFGLLALATDLTSEGDLARLFPPAAAVHTTRVAYANPTTPENLRKMEPLLTAAAALLVPDVELAAICFSCTSASATIGDAKVTAAIQAAKPGVPVITPTAAASAAFRALGVNSIAVVTPYLPEATVPVGSYFRAQGFSVTALDCLGLEDDRAMARVSRETIIAAALAADGPDNDAIFLSCTALPAIAAIAEIEARTGKPVVTSNQASAWAMAQKGGLADWKPAAYGRLFRTCLAAPSDGRAA